METEYILGVDPGFDGGFALFAPETDPYSPIQLYAYNTPCIKVPFMKNGRKSERREMIVDQVTTLLRPYYIKYAYVEKVHAMPKQGGTGMFRFGENFGQWTGILSGLGITEDRRFYPTPQKWKKRFELHANKEGSLVLARDIFPLHESTFKRKKDDGVAEACLIAVFGAEERGYNISNLPVLFS